MNQTNQQDFRKLLTDRIAELEAAAQRNRDMQATTKDPHMIAAHNATACTLTDVAFELRNTVRQFDQFADPSDSELDARLQLTQNHSESLLLILTASKKGTTALLDVLGAEVSKLTATILDLRRRYTAVTPPGIVGHIYEPEVTGPASGNDHVHPVFTGILNTISPGTHE